jgi:hypothetical protein
MKPAPLFKIIALTGLLLSGLFCSAQDKKDDSKFKFGLKGSLNLNWVKANSKNIEKDGISMGYSYGIMGDFNFAKSYAFSTEFLITQIKANFSFVNPMSETSDINMDSSTTIFPSVSAQFNLKYIQLPLSLKFKTKEIGSITYWAQFGFAPSFLIGAKGDYVGAEPSEDYSKLDINDAENDKYHLINTKDSKEFDDKVFLIRVPLIIGAGIEYNLSGTTSLYTGLRIDNGFSNTFVKDKNTKALTNFVSINLGLFF